MNKEEERLPRIRFSGCILHDEEANKFCCDPLTHHLLKYHDPQSKFYIGDDCVNCIGSFLEKRWYNHYIP